MKKILIGVLVLVVIIAAGAFFLLGNLDGIVKAAVEKIGSDLTQTTVTLDDVNIGETSGRGVFRGFRVTNPDGFSDDAAFKFDEVSVIIDTASILSDPVIIKEVVIIGPVVVYEFGDGGTNLDRLNKKVQSKAGISSAGGDSEGPKFIIENLYLRGGKLAVQAPLLNEKIILPLPTIHLTDIGKEGRGTTPGDIADQLMEAILAAAGNAISGANIDIGSLTESAGELAKDAQKVIEEASGNIAKEAGDAIEGVGEAVKGIFKSIGK
ncbi:MAG: hypothetical protein E2O93_01970 [Alphaproteobacteria bacterium]|nr:MAG: hypothetical protein E2O93_01970 [Alphaproteobacteria bacterium]